MDSQHSLFILGNDNHQLFFDSNPSHLSAKTLGGSIHLSNHFAGQLGSIYKHLKYMSLLTQ